jgi:hypothetical protein
MLKKFAGEKYSSLLRKFATFGQKMFKTLGPGLLAFRLFVHKTVREGFIFLNDKVNLDKNESVKHPNTLFSKIP